ncbi:glycoside hydrolase domain-containing protein [Catelliglobosispora koreensis]|uniref:glycoside hydrolase domain-containing protein n=1 Tax=Catelliglobosispora koreensis TaxID=129052 RepID=UPI00035DEA87|nr:glycoside hydrolase domain-containing protein [Catelliglobosispora koreensis]
MRKILAGVVGLMSVLYLAITPASAATARLIAYQGYRVEVPLTWRVVDLSAHPDACVRFDEPAVYLGRPGNQESCPSDLRGRTAGLIIEPMAAERLSQSTSDTAQFRAGGVLVTAHFTPDTEATVRGLVGKTATPVAASLPAAAAVAPQPGIYTGRGFDTCAAPSQSTMNAWRNSSPYRAIGIYISGGSRSCSQPNLTASWVTNQTNNGWRLIPIELGRQAPCGTRTPKMSSDPATARSQGMTSASSAVSAAQALGIPPGSAIYNDIEHYPSNASCRAAVLSYLSGWTQRLHALGYLSGMYSSGSSGITDVCNAYHDPQYTRLDHLWIAWWNGVADTDAGSYCPDDYYSNHQRLHQYAGDVDETWGGVRVHIDRNYLDVSTTVEEPPPGFTEIVDNTTAGRFTASANWGTSAFSAQRYGTDYRFANPVSSSDVAWYKVAIPETDTYEVSVWYPANSGYNDATPFIVATTSGNQSVLVNQRVNGGQWVSLGVFTLAAGDADRVGVSRWTNGTGYVIADAIRITRV